MLPRTTIRSKQSLHGMGACQRARCESRKGKEALERELEKERAERAALDVRVAKMEAAFQRGAGMVMLIPILGTALG